MRFDNLKAPELWRLQSYFLEQPRNNMSRNTSEAAITAREQEQDNQSQSEQQAFSSEPEIAQATGAHADDKERMTAQPKPDVSDQDYAELLPKLLSHFHNKREELARAVGVHRSTVDRWLNNTSRPNNSTVLRMRRLAQERRIE